jgi:hypothetical protein
MGPASGPTSLGPQLRSNDLRFFIKTYFTWVLQNLIILDHVLGPFKFGSCQ